MRKWATQECECCDAGCQCVGQCHEPAKRTLYRVDMVDQTGTRMCPGCAEDADESGVFDDKPNTYS